MKPTSGSSRGGHSGYTQPDSFLRCEEYFLCKYQPPEGVSSVGEHVELEINLYLQRFPPQQRHLRGLIFDYLLKRESCITGCHSMDEVDLMNIGRWLSAPLYPC